MIDIFSECLAETGQTITHTTAANIEDSKYRQIFRLRELHLLAFFILIYVGVEVTLGGVHFLTMFQIEFEGLT